MLLTILILLACAGVIYVSCEYFVNGVEWLGRTLRVSENATGTILAAFGTALPESAVTLAAVAFGASAEQQHIGVGAAPVYTVLQQQARGQGAWACHRCQNYRRPWRAHRLRCPPRRRRTV